MSIKKLTILDDNLNDVLLKKWKPITTSSEFGNIILTSDTIISYITVLLELQQTINKNTPYDDYTIRRQYFLSYIPRFYSKLLINTDKQFPAYTNTTIDDIISNAYIIKQFTHNIDIEDIMLVESHYDSDEIFIQYIMTKIEEYISDSFNNSNQCLLYWIEINKNNIIIKASTCN